MNFILLSELAIELLRIKTEVKIPRTRMFKISWLVAITSRNRIYHFNIRKISISVIVLLNMVLWAYLIGRLRYLRHTISPGIY